MVSAERLSTSQQQGGHVPSKSKGAIGGYSTHRSAGKNFLLVVGSRYRKLRYKLHDLARLRLRESRLDRQRARKANAELKGQLAQIFTPKYARLECESIKLPRCIHPRIIYDTIVVYNRELPRKKKLDQVVLKYRVVFA